MLSQATRTIPANRLFPPTSPTAPDGPHILDHLSASTYPLRPPATPPPWPPASPGTSQAYSTISAYTDPPFPLSFNQHVLIDTTPMPAHIPKVDEIGASSAPLMSASYFIGARCKAYNDDFMKCKTESNGRGELDCLREGRKVTRCAASVYVRRGFEGVVVE